MTKIIVISQEADIGINVAKPTTSFNRYAILILYGINEERTTDWEIPTLCL